MTTLPPQRIGILNFPGHANHGANLTAYALQQLLLDMGHDVANVHLRMNYRMQKDTHCTGFADKYIKMTNRCAYGNAEMEQFNDEFDCFITGSDQVWRYEQSDIFKWKENFISSFFLGFAAPGKRRISVAASFGTSCFDAPEQIKQMASLELSRYTAISVRETPGQRIVKELSNKEAQLLIDPVFYLPREHWSELCKDAPSISTEPYIAYNSFALEDQIKSYQKTHQQQNIHNLLDYSTLSWMRGIRDAEFVLTDSFHVTCYCLIFGTPFACLCNEAWGISRLYGLAEMFGFSSERVIDIDHCADSSAAIESIRSTPVDWDCVWANMDSHQNDAKQWLSDALNAAIPEWQGPTFQPATKQEAQAQKERNVQWRCKQGLQRKLLIIRILLACCPFNRKFLHRKRANLTRVLSNLSW